MADFNGIGNLLNTTEGMTAVSNNSRNDDSTVSFTGVSWFHFNSLTCETMYYSGNAWIGFGSSSENLQVCRRDAANYSFYRQEGTLFNYYSFLKLRWEGYTIYSSTDVSCRLIYELFLISDGRMFLYVIQSPTDSSVLGYSQLNCGGNTYSLTIGVNSTCPISYTFTPTDPATGAAWTAANEMIVVTAPYDRKYLASDKSGKFYTVTNGALVELTGITALSAAIFKESGIDAAPDGNLIKALINPVIYFWQDSADPLPALTAAVTAIPKPQTVLSENVDMRDATILGIESVTADSDDATLFAVSFDGGTSWYSYVSNAWVLLSEAQSGMTKGTLNAIGADAWAAMATTGFIRFRFVLFENSYVNSIYINYLN